MIEIPFNRELFIFLYGSVHQHVLFDSFWIFLATQLPYICVLVLALFLVVDFARHKKMVVTALISALIARFVIKPLILLFYLEPRPFVVIDTVIPLISPPPNEDFQSFPSGHTIFFFALASTIYCFHKKWGIVFLIAALCIGLSRVFVGVHWPQDILGGILIGSVIGWLVYHISQKIK
jgi:undecaprenyl-diphosphatase